MKRAETSISPEAIAYLHGRIDKEIELLAASTLHCTSTELAERLGSLLLGQGIRVEHNLPPLREAPARASQTVATLEMVSGPHSKPSRRGMSPENRKRISNIAKQRWAKMTDRQRTLLLNKMARGRLKSQK
jgi:hypothetical protein